MAGAAWLLPAFLRDPDAPPDPPAQRTTSLAVLIPWFSMAAGTLLVVQSVENSLEQLRQQGDASSEHSSQDSRALLGLSQEHLEFLRLYLTSGHLLATRALLGVALLASGMTSLKSAALGIRVGLFLLALILFSAVQGTGARDQRVLGLREALLVLGAVLALLGSASGVLAGKKGLVNSTTTSQAALQDGNAAASTASGSHDRQKKVS